jgi:hypothetical protein
VDVGQDRDPHAARLRPFGGQRRRVALPAGRPRYRRRPVHCSQLRPRVAPGLTCGFLPEPAGRDWRAHPYRLVGAGLDQSIKQLPARHRIGPAAFAAYSQAADLHNGIPWYAILGLGTAALTLFAATVGRRDPTRPAVRKARPVAGKQEAKTPTRTSSSGGNQPR